MDYPYVEKYPGVNDELFIIRITNQYSHLLVSIYLLIIDNGEEREIVVRKNEYPSDKPLNSIIEEAKNAINLMTIAKKHDPNSETPLFDKI